MFKKKIENELQCLLYDLYQCECVSDLFVDVDGVEGPLVALQPPH